jgi:hypothetical protein
MFIAAAVDTTGLSPLTPNSLESVLIEPSFCITWAHKRVFRTFLRVFAKLLKATVSSVMSVCPSVVVEQLGSNWKNSHEVLYLSGCRKSVSKIQVLLKSVTNDGYFT